MTELRGLGYLRVSTTDVARWRELTVGALGFAEGAGPEPGGLYLRMDERSARVIVLPGETDHVLSVGWVVRDQFALAAVGTAVEAAGVAVKPLSAEVFFGPLLDHSPLVTSLGQRFVTGEQGLGHVVLPTTAMPETVAFYTEILGFCLCGALRLGAVGFVCFWFLCFFLC